MRSHGSTPTATRATAAHATGCIAAVAITAGLLVGLVGCDQPPPIRQYTISTEVPAALSSQDRMLAAIVPQQSELWFFKLVGPTEAVEFAEPEVRAFIQQVEFVDGQPDLDSLPQHWKLSGERPMRFATAMIPTPGRELELSISSLPKSGSWDEQVAMNVNRWRGQMALADSTQRWAGAEPLRSEDSGDEPPVWVDLTGEMGPAPMAGSGSPPFASGSELPPGHPEIPAGGAAGQGAASDSGGSGPEANRPPMAAGDSAAGDDGDDESAENPGGLKYDAPQDWRQGKMSMMRMAAFEIGPEDRTAELTIIQAGGDLRGNVDRWLGQVRGESPPPEVVDAALQDAEQLRVSGHDAQRFYLTDGEQDSADAQAIDATIVPLDGGMSLFIKATGPAATLSQQRAAIGEFLESLTLPQ